MAQMQEVEQAFQRFGQRMSAHMEHVGKALGPVLKKMHAAMWAAYDRAGRPYGDSEEGLLRWAKEVGEANRLREEAQRIEIDHASLALVRRKSTTTFSA